MHKYAFGKFKIKLEKRYKQVATLKNFDLHVFNTLINKLNQIPLILAYASNIAAFLIRQKKLILFQWRKLVQF